MRSCPRTCILARCHYRYQLKLPAKNLSGPSEVSGVEQVKDRHPQGVASMIDMCIVPAFHFGLIDFLVFAHFACCASWAVPKSTTGRFVRFALASECVTFPVRDAGGEWRRSSALGWTVPKTAKLQPCLA